MAPLTVTAEGVDWDAAGVRAPGATWTYLVHDQVYGGNVMRALTNRASIGLWGVLLLWPVLLVWGLHQRWRHRRRAHE